MRGLSSNGTGFRESLFHLCGGRLSINMLGKSSAQIKEDWQESEAAEGKRGPLNAPTNPGELRIQQ